MEFEYLNNPAYEITSNIKGISEMLHMSWENLSQEDVKRFKKSIIEEFDKLEQNYE